MIQLISTRPRRIVGAALLMLWTMTAIAANPSHAAELGPVKEITFQAKIDGTDQKYLQRLPAGFDAAKTYPVLIALHGHGSDRTQGVSDRAEFKAAQDAAAKYGMIYISPDYRAPASWMNIIAEADMIQIIGDVRRTYRVSKLILDGASMGGTAALTFAAVRPDLIDGVCSQNGSANLIEFETRAAGIQDAIQAAYGGTRAEVPLEYKKRSAEYWPERLGMPVAIQAGGKDDVVPAASVLRLAGVLQKIGKPVLLTFRPEGGHDTSYEDTMTGLDFVITTALKSWKGH